MNEYNQSSKHEEAQLAKPTAIPPNKHIMALITFILLVPLVYFIPELINPFLPENKLVQVVAAVGIIVVIISYIALPITLALLARLRRQRSD